ncbi:MAG: alpha/beta fold hydrolase [Thermoleophilia bacterium]|nr:alpha/beta fold hydrolase [Thermoleophilia bacterium]
MHRIVRERPFASWLLAAILITTAVWLPLTACGDDTAATTASTTPSTNAATSVDGAAPTGTTRVDTGVPEVVTFSTEDGLTLSGTLYGTGDRGVILAHMYPADQTSWSSIAEGLAREGYLVLTFDFRGYGASEGERQIEKIHLDVTAAVQRIREAGAAHVVVAGASMGGTAGLIAAVDLQTDQSIRLAGVITLSSPVEFMGLTALEAVPALGVPLLFVAAEGDVGADNARLLANSAASAGLLIVDGDEHGTELFRGPSADEVRNALSLFLSENMAGND